MAEERKIVKKLRKETGMSQSEFAAYFCIPIKTLRDWEQERRVPPAYIVNMMERILNNEYFRKEKVNENE